MRTAPSPRQRLERRLAYDPHFQQEVREHMRAGFLFGTAVALVRAARLPIHAFPRWLSEWRMTKERS